MADLGTMSVGLGLETSGLESGLGRATGLLGSFGATAVVAAGAAVIGLGAASVKMAGDFQASMTSLVTGAGESQANIKAVSDGILAMAPSVGQTTDQLAAGMYMIESAGYHGAAGLKVLQDAAEGAKVGNADLGVVADATTTILNDFGKTGVTSANAVNLLINTVAAGKTHMEDLAGSLAQILPTASAAHVGLTDIMGAMATMTAEGIPAANAATYLRQTILALDAPGSKAAATLQEVGLSTTQVANEMQQSLPGAIQMIVDAVGKKFPVGSAAYVAAIKDIAGGSKTMQGILDLSGDHLATFEQNVKNITGSVKTAGNSIAGWSAVQGTWNQQVAEAKAQVSVWGIELGTKLLPVVENVGAGIAKNLVPAVQDLATWLDKNMIPAAENAANLFDKDVLPSLENLATFTEKNVIPTVGQFATWIMTKVVPAAIQLEGNLDKNLVPVLETVWSVIQHDVVPNLETIGNTVTTKVLPPVETIISKLSPVLVPAFQAVGWVLGNVVGPALNASITLLGTFVSWIANAITAVGNFLGLLGHIKDAVGNALGGVGNALHDAHIPGFASGTAYAPGGLAVVGENGPELVDLPRGSRVYPTGTAPAHAASGGGNHYHVHVTNQAPTVRQVMNGFRQMELLYG